MMTENARLFRWSSCWSTRNFLCYSFETNSFSSPTLHIQYEKGALDDKKIPANNDRSFDGISYMYTNDIALLQIDLTISRLLMYLFNRIWIIGHPIGRLLNKWLACFAWFMSTRTNKEKDEFSLKNRKLY